MMDLVVLLDNIAMAHVMCTQKLWRALRQPGRPPLATDEPLLVGASLGSWAAKVFRVDRRDLVIALNERTYLTLVFPLAPRTQFRTSFSKALDMALRDLGVPEPNVFLETSALEFEPLTRLTNRSLAGTLNDLEFHCAIELDYHADLRRVQLNLNEIPHARREPCVPINAVWQLFRLGNTRGSLLNPRFKD